MMTCPACSTTDVYSSHRRGFLERRPLTWIGILPFRCGQCQTRFYRLALKDPRRRRERDDSDSAPEQRRAPRWTINVAAVVTAYLPGQPSVTVHGMAENASLGGVRLRLPVALTEGSHLSVALVGGPSRLGNVRWVQDQGESGVVHGIRYHTPPERRSGSSRPLRRISLRRLSRRILIGVIGLIGIVTVAYCLVWLLEGLRFYAPKYYEPKDIQREGARK